MKKAARIALLLLVLLAPLMVALALSMPFAAHAQSCYPGLDNATHIATQARAGLTKNGGWLRWYCIPRDVSITTVEANRYVSTPAELSKWGARLQTIAKAPDPLKSLRTAGTRFTILPITDPSLAAIVADMNAAP